jgi:hypothetical protein
MEKNKIWVEGHPKFVFPGWPNFEAGGDEKLKDYFIWPYLIRGVGESWKKTFQLLHHLKPTIKKF